MRCLLPIIAIIAALDAPLSVSAADTPPDWLKRPTPEEILGLWPRDALRKGLTGKAEITCIVTVQGLLRDCSVVRETPPNEGFGAAALALTPQLTFRPATHDGKPVERRGNVPVNFAGPTGGYRQGPGYLAPIRASVIANLPWMAAPTYAQVVAAYPERARADHVPGHAALNCQLGADGRLPHCDVITEAPSGYGFGKAAKALAKEFLAPRTDSAGASVRGDSTQIAFAFAPGMLNGETPVIGRPQWMRLPQGADVTAGFPAAALAAHVYTGHVTLACDVGVAGRLANCAVVNQSPDGLGFDEAALALSADFQVSVWTQEGLPTVGGRISVPIRYESPAPKAAAATP